MSKFRLALVRQKYRPDGGAERFVSRALEALDSSNLELNVITREWQGPVKPDWNIHICNPRKWGRISRERGFADAARRLWQSEHFDLVQSHERIPGCDLYRAGDGVHRRWLQQRSRILPGWKSRLLFADRYHRYVMQAEREMYQDSHLRGVICNAEMIKREIIEDFGLPAEKIHVIYNAIDNQRFLPPTEAAFVALRHQWNLPLQATCLIYVGSGFERKGLDAAIRAIAPTDRYLLVVGKDKDQNLYQSLAKTLNCEERVRFSACSRKPCRSIRWPTACCCRRCTIRSPTLFSKRWPAACRSLPPPAAAARSLSFRAAMATFAMRWISRPCRSRLAPCPPGR